MSKQKTKTEEIAEAINNPLPVEMKDSEGLPVTNEIKKRVFRTLVSGAEFHDFEKDSTVYAGFYGKPVLREKDGLNAEINPNERAGSVMGFLFKDENGVDTIIGNSHQVAKALEQAKEGDFYRIEFLGKTQNAQGKPVNRFKIDIAI